MDKAIAVGLGWYLVATFDVRPIDWHTGKRLAVPEAEMLTCDRCGRSHAKGYVVRNPDGREMTVGCTCWKRLVFDNDLYHPVSAVKKMENAARAGALSEAANDYADRIASTPLPRGCIVAAEREDLVFQIVPRDHTLRNMVRGELLRARRVSSVTWAD